jgi:hypothetical protein
MQERRRSFDSLPLDLVRWSGHTRNNSPLVFPGRRRCHDPCKGVAGAATFRFMAGMSLEPEMEDCSIAPIVPARLARG